MNDFFIDNPGNHLKIFSFDVKDLKDNEYYMESFYLFKGKFYQFNKKNITRGEEK